MKSLVWILFLSFFIMSCGENVPHSDRTILESFPENINVKFQEYLVEPVLYYVGDMEIVNNRLITIDMKNDVFFQFFQLPDLNYLGSDIKRGEGPDEEIAILPYIYSLHKDTFVYRSLYQVKMAVFDEKQHEIKVIRKIELPTSYMDILNCTMDENSILGYNMMGNNQREFQKFDFFDGEKEVSDFGPSFPEVGIQIEGDKKNMVFTKVIVSNSFNNKFVALYDKFPLLRIYDRNNGEVLHEIEYKNGQKKPLAYADIVVEPLELNEYTINYLKVKVTNNYIYGLYSGKTNNELNADGNVSGDCGSEIHIWDWNGNAISRLVLPENVSAFAVSPDDLYILLYSFTHDDLLYKVNLQLGGKL